MPKITLNRTSVHHCAVLFLFLSVGLQSIAQRYFIQNFSAKDGLSQSEVGNIIQVPTGELYLTTAALGVDVFDGVEFKRFGIKDGLMHEYIGKIHRDSQDIIWFFSSKGAMRVESDSIFSYPLDNKFYGIESVFSVIELDRNQFLIGTNVGVFHLQEGEYSETVYPDLELRCFGFLKWNETLLVASNLGLFEWSDGVLSKSSLFPDDIEILAIEHSLEGGVLLGVRQGFFRLNETETEFVPLFESSDYSVICFLKTSENKILAGTNGQGLFILNEELIRISESNGLSDDFIWTLHEDMDGKIWIGTSGGGLDLLATDHFQILSTREGLSSDIVYDIVERADASVWFGQVQGGVSVLRNGEIENYAVADGLSHLTVRCFHDAGDTLYLGTENGLTIYVDGRFKDVSAKFGVADHAIFDIHQDRHGNLWFACKGERYYGENGGVVKYSKGSITNFTVNDGLPSNNVYCIREKENGDLWFGTTGGIGRWDGEQMALLDIWGESNCRGTVLTMLDDSRNGTWIGTVNGLVLYNETESRCVSGEGVAGETIYFLESQGDSILWIGSAGGLEKLDLNHFYFTGELLTEYYDDNNGFVGTECNQNAVTKDADGNYWFGTIGGAVKYLPKNDSPDLSPLRLSIKDVRIGGEEVDWKKRGYSVGLGGVPQSIELSHSENSIQIEYLAVNLIDPDIVEYSFSLGNKQGDWSSYSKDNTVFFADLEPDEYQLKVRARNVNSGALSETVTYSFEIIPAYWQTTWFKGLMWFLGILGLLSFFFWRMRSVRNHEAEKRDFQAQLNELEMTALRAQMNPHFLFNSLNSVNSFIIKNDKEQASEYLTKFSRLVRLVLQNSEEKIVSMEDELNALRLYVQLESLRFSEGFEYVEQIDDNVDLEKYSLPPLMLQPYAENAIWHGLLHLEERRGRLLVALEEDNNGLVIRIEDNGVGRAKAELMKSKSAIKKKSMGMKINADRMGLTESLHDFKISLAIEDLIDEGQEAIGTRVKIRINRHEE